MGKAITLGFTLVLLGLSLVGMAFVYRGMLSYEEKLQVELRVKDMILTQSSVLRDFSRAADIVATRALAAAVGHVVTSGNPLDDAKLRIQELMLNGTLNQTFEPLMEGNTLQEWMKKIEAAVLGKGYELSLDLQKLEALPWDSWHLLINATLWINLTDLKGVANLSKLRVAQQLVSIEGQEDPLYPLHTYGRAVNVLKRTPYEGNYTLKLVQGLGWNWTRGLSWVCLDPVLVNQIPEPAEKVLVINFSLQASVANQFKGVVSEADLPELQVPYVKLARNATKLIPNQTQIVLNEGSVWYVENLREHIAKSWYQSSTDGASFLDRLEGKLKVQTKYAQLAPYPIGLESFVDKEYLATLDLPIRLEQTNLDYLYFNETDIPGLRIKGLQATVRIDPAHLSAYGVEGLV